MAALRLAPGSFTSVNIRNVTSDGVVVGEVHIHRRSGWRGGPSYRFHPTDANPLKLPALQSSSVRDLLILIATTSNRQIS